MKTIHSIILVLLCTTILNSQVINVPADQTSIQAAIDIAADGDTVLVEEGTFLENINFLGKAITVASRFIMDGDPAHILKTIIDGSQANNPDTASVVTMWSGEDTTSVLMGFTITGGGGGTRMQLGVYTDYYGGGIVIEKSGGKILNNIIEENHVVQASESTTVFGGGIGGRVYGNHTLIVRDNLIRNNSVDGNRACGAGISLNGGRIIIENNHITDNTMIGRDADAGGGIFWASYGFDGVIEEVIIRNNIIDSNKGSIVKYYAGGGGIFTGSAFSTPIHIYNNVISDNSCGGMGGGIFNWESSMILFNNTIINNSSAMGGNAFYMGGGDVVFINNIIWSYMSYGHSDFSFTERSNYILLLHSNLLTEALESHNSVISRQNIFLDPDLDPLSYEPNKTSPAIGRGVDSVLFMDDWHPAPLDDFYGINRKSTSSDQKLDLGAIESSYNRYKPVRDSDHVINVPEEEPTIQAGIIAASEGDTVLVSEGYYYENINFLGKAITVASEFLLDPDEVHISKTIIDGSQSSNPDTASTTLFISGEDTTSVLMGFTIRGGTGTVVKNLYEEEDFRIGGGLAILNSGGKIINNNIKENHLLVTGSNALTPYGGGLFALVTGNHQAIIRDNKITNNSISGKSASAGGIGLFGGGILIEDNYISKNSVSSMGSRDYATGGGIEWSNEIKETAGYVTIRNNWITGNILSPSSGLDFGGGISIYRGRIQNTVEIYNNVIPNHHLKHLGSALHVKNQLSTVTIFNNTIVDNYSENKGCSVVLETKQNKNILLYNNIIWSDLHNSQEEVYVWDNNSPVRIYNNLLSTRLNPIKAIYEDNNVYQGPVFLPNSYKLSEFSPGIGRGVDSLEINGSLFVAPPIDLLGNPRPHPIDGLVDLGAIESPYEGGFLNIPDTAFLFALISEGVDINEDSLISFEEAETVTSLMVNGNVDEEVKGEISDMTGIEAFVNLKNLSCFYNKITHIDISTIQGLVTLSCWGNNLEKIGLSNNPMLESLQLSQNNIRFLNVSKNTLLKDLRVQYNDLGRLDVTKNTALQYLDCNFNNLKVLITANNKELVYLACSGNQISRQNVSQNPLLETFNCVNNNIEYLNLTNNKLLKNLRCSGNILGTLDIRENTMLEKLRISDMEGLGKVCVWEMPLPPLGVTVDSTGSPNVYFTTDCTTDVEKVNLSGFSIYPNPTGSQITIETVVSGHYSIKIVSVNGQVIHRETMDGNTHQIDLTPFRKGVYFITIRSEAYIATRKIIKL